VHVDLVLPVALLLVVDLYEFGKAIDGRRTDPSQRNRNTVTVALHAARRNCKSLDSLPFDSRKNGIPKLLPLTLVWLVPVLPFLFSIYFNS
jgi:hypothetical protein